MITKARRPASNVLTKPSRYASVRRFGVRQNSHHLRVPFACASEEYFTGTEEAVQAWAVLGDIFAAGFAGVGFGIAILDRFGALVFANDVMRHFESAGFLTLEERKIAFTRTKDERSVREALVACQRRGASGSETLIVLDRLERESLIVTLTQTVRGNTILRATHRDCMPRVTAMAFECTLQLSSAEAVVAQLLLRGLDVRSIAVHLCVSPETIRSHLKRLFSKTDTHRQPELLLALVRAAELHREW